LQVSASHFVAPSFFVSPAWQEPFRSTHCFVSGQQTTVAGCGQGLGVQEAASFGVSPASQDPNRGVQVPDEAQQTFFSAQVFASHAPPFQLGAEHEVLGVSGLQVVPSQQAPFSSSLQVFDSQVPPFQPVAGHKILDLSEHISPSQQAPFS
jgi:hypothetical protein